MEYVPLYNVSLLGGQYFFAGDRTKLNGNVAARIAPIMKMSDEWTFLPLYRGSYRGTKGVTDAVGSGTLFQQEMDHRVAFTGVYTAPDSDWKLKPSVNYKYEFLKETRDEAWGKGLFDYQTAGLSFEGEKVYRDPFSYRLGYDFYYVRFTNYESLESQSGVDPSGNRLNRENAGTRVLDTFNHQVSFVTTVPLPAEEPKVSLEMGYRGLLQMFPDQPLIDKQGQPILSNRRDFTNSLSFSLAYPRPVFGGRARMSSGWYLGLSRNDSNQSTYDAGQTRYVPETYTYYSFTTGPNATFSWGEEKRPVTAGLGFLFSTQRYLGRLVQDGTGLYLGEMQHQERYILNLSYGYPVAQNFRLTAQTNFLWADSNMKYERTYKYTYNAATYLMGFTYDY